MCNGTRRPLELAAALLACGLFIDCCIDVRRWLHTCTLHLHFEQSYRPRVNPAGAAGMLQLENAAADVRHHHKGQMCVCAHACVCKKRELPSVLHTLDIGDSDTQKLLVREPEVLSSRPAERRLARFGLTELLQRRRVVRQQPALVRQWSAPTARMERVVGVHRPRARMPFPHHLDHAVAGEMCAEEFRCFCWIVEHETQAQVLVVRFERRFQPIRKARGT